VSLEKTPNQVTPFLYVADCSIVGYNSFEVKMKNQKFTKIKNRSLYSIKVYLDDKELSERIEKLALDMGLSLSSAGGMIIRYGLPEMEKAVEKIRGQEHEAKKRSK